MQELGIRTFAATGLTEVTLPDTLRYVSAGTFMNCTNLEKITIPYMVRGYAFDTFDGDSKLTIYGYEKSAAADHASWRHIPFVSIGEMPENAYALDKGDLNGDNTISVEDAQIVLNAYTNAMAGLESGLTDEQKKQADVNEDGEISVDDAQYILIYYARFTLAEEIITWEDVLGTDKKDKT